MKNQNVFVLVKKGPLSNFLHLNVRGIYLVKCVFVYIKIRTNESGS